MPDLTESAPIAAAGSDVAPADSPPAAIRAGGCTGLVQVAARIMNVEDVDGNVSSQEVQAFCLHCRLIAGAEGLFVTAPQLALEQRLLDAPIHFKAQIGQHGTAQSLGLLRWEEINYLTSPESVSTGVLFGNFAAYGGSAASAQLRGTLRNYVGLTRGKRKRMQATPLGEITIDDGLIVHVLDPIHPERFDANHLAYWPLNPSTLLKPTEIWLSDPTPQNPKPMRLFLARYQIGSEIKNHMAIVNPAKNRLTSAFMLNGLQQAEGRRMGTLLYSAIAEAS
jgi:hypothetical protein